MINGASINGATLNGGTAGNAPQPVVVGGEQAIVWRARVRVNGEDWTARLVGEVAVDREEGAAGVAEFALCLPAGPVTPNAWRGREVTADYIDQNGESRLFTGRIIEPSWNRTSRLLTCACSDNLQERVEALDVPAIDALTPNAWWTEDVFEPVTGRSHWDYMQERMQSVQASLDCAADGTLRVTSWYAKGQADYEFLAGATVYDTVDVQLSDNTRETNQVEIEAEYRFSRLQQLNKSYYWQHPFTGGLGGEGGFCEWFSDTTETPNIEMVTAALADSGQTLLSGASWYRLPPSGIYCDPPVGWNNNFTDLLLGAGFTGARRWVQTVTERYALTVVADAAVATDGEVVTRDSVALEVESAQAETWESAGFGVNTAAPSAGGGNNGIPGGSGGLTPGRPIDNGSNGHTDVRDEPRRQQALGTVLRHGVTTIISEHRGTTVSWDVPAGWVHGIDLPHTARIADQGVHAKGKINRLTWRLDLLGGSAMCTVSIALMRGGGTASDPLTLPAYSVKPQPDPPGPDPIADSLPTQIGGKGETYIDELDGFSGSWSVGDGSSEGFPRRFQITADEILATERDPLEVDIEATYRVAIPNDTLELT
ncbi:MAG: hypothetical protein KKG30_00725 [Gammaproteobacteria bacterium]|nr:hypothetical protein [Gammaproteobacteria bacterium]MBU1492219.1 hypothetical protein [Gammaproteobacteria bacterium]MBU2066790.1 hypothetical protein [Gammaproteobacteria bacterium]MBU2137394.1 hypothetical protein [Gammaproteobacteria bacterium]MBU2215045.1 hypothetical protein [Gammaproteobacteria bacterium]